MVYIDHILLTYSLFDEHVGYFHLLATVNHAAMNMCVQIFLQDPVTGYIPRSRIAGS